MADNEPHAVVRLLLKRMESHPEEFRVGPELGLERWEEYIDAVRDHGNEADNAALTAKLRDIRLAEIHEQVMDELLNGPERRRKHEEDREYERHLAQAMQHTQQQAMQQAIQQYGGVGGGMVQGLMNAYGGGGGGSGASLPVSTSPYSSGGGSILPVANGGTGIVGESITGLKANSLVIDDQVLDGPMIKKIKRMMTGRSK